VGLGYLAAYLLKKGLVRPDDIRIVDSVQEAVDFRPDIVGVGSVSQVLTDARQFARQCKQTLGCLTILGGYHATCIPHRLPEEFDFAVLGEGEQTFAEIVEKFTQGPLDEDVLASIHGLAYRRNGEIRTTTPRALIADIDQLPWPHRHKSYSHEEPVFTTRGCPYRCTFCASHTFWRDSIRFRSAEEVVNEIAHIVDAHGPKNVVFLDDLWIAKKNRFRAIVRMLEERGIPDKVGFHGFCRSNLVDEETVLLFKRLNYRFVRFGAETGSDRLLQRIKGKGIHVSDHQRAIDLCAKHGLSCTASFILGVPGETKEDLELTIRFLRKNKGKFRIQGFYLFNPIPGTQLWTELEEQGIVTEDLDLSRLQLDLGNSRFTWDDVLYFNHESVPLHEFHKIVENIRKEFFARPVRRIDPRHHLKRVLRASKRVARHWLRQE
jgi:radical SAM superfamily enzyme YgiQ (UPF0313 family)